MSQIQSGASADLLTIGATNKAARVEQFDALGNPVVTNNDNSFIAKVEVIPTTLTAATPYFSFFNTSGGNKKMYITSLNLLLGFAGTIAASRSLFELVRISAAAPTGGTAVAASRKDNSKPTSIGADIRFAPAGLTLTGVTAETDGFDLIGNTNQLTFANLTRRTMDNAPLVLAPNEGILLRANTAIVAGSYVAGSIQWDER